VREPDGSFRVSDASLWVSCSAGPLLGLPASTTSRTLDYLYDVLLRLTLARVGTTAFLGGVTVTLCAAALDVNGCGRSSPWLSLYLPR